MNLWSRRALHIEEQPGTINNERTASSDLLVPSAGTHSTVYGRDAATSTTESAAFIVAPHPQFLADKSSDKEKQRELLGCCPACIRKGEGPASVGSIQILTLGCTMG